MMVGLIGDLEGERAAAADCLRLLGERGDVDVACQLGDLRFGYGPDPEGCLDDIETLCAEYGIELLCITGNHENWAFLDTLWSDPRWRDEDGTLRPIAVRDHVTMLPRGFRWELGGRSIVALGSAPSVNRGLLTEGVDWWPSEVLREEHVQATIAGGHADVMLTHDSPARPYCTAPVADIVAGNPMGWPADALAYAAEGMDNVTRAVLGVRPRFLAHGLFHVAGEADVRLPGADHDTRIWSLAARQDPGNVRVLDLDTLTDPGAAPLS
ncbi:metallophosphoesterase [Nocardioides sp. S-58]|uniref:Metallophosphoesterase n=1 Tax=Nocardioides renjunii TaxID=3095075 RepID=A0ABU5KC19_9ACTN|nr:metallophosphoesterase [Nocardioides sp. S-58]MDZ5662404.1 metallophosphoesterase [Nocardioides sp. S-58]